MEHRTDSQTLGSRLRRARRARGLTLQAVAARLARPVTRAALSKYELGEVVPRADVLLDLARVLELPASHFLESPGPGSVSVQWRAYRKHSGLGTRQRERIQARAELLCEAYLDLIDRLEPGRAASLPRWRPARDVEDSEQAANELRATWGLGTGPIERLVEHAEDAGILILEWKESGRFDALSGWAAKELPVVVLNIERRDDRRRFNLAHELGHLILDGRDLESGEEERLAHRFAAAFLIPREAALRELGVRRSHVTVRELEILKRKYGVSMQAWTRRARDLGIVTEASYRNWQIWFRSQGLHVRESTDYAGEERASRLRLLSLRGLAERVVDREWVRRVCPEALEGEEGTEQSGPEALLRASREQRRRALEQAAEKAAKDYAQDPEVDEFLSFDDQEPND